MAPVVIIQDGRPILKTMRWGLIPFWSKDPKIGSKCFNARAETVEEKPAFRSAFKTHRCLVPADSYFEWRTENVYRQPSSEDYKDAMERKQPQPTEEFIGTKKIPYRFKVAGNEIFSLAGLWSTWKDPKGQDIETFTIITCEPNEVCAHYHNRMPAILRRDQEHIWADPNFTNPVLLKNILKPYPGGQIEIAPAEDSIFKSI